MRSALRTYKGIEFYPVQHFTELLRGIAKEAGDDETTVRNEIARAGEFIAGVATSTFLKLLMKVLTPTLFAKKLPSLWERDNQGGQFVADVSKADEGRLTLELKDIEGYDYIGPIALGWVRFAMSAMGEKVLESSLEGWSLANPSPKTVTLRLRWEK
ncbi:MAG: hypothetical protein KC657_32675 [Myxococcales bacterium]|nr:hypothetical protein [Myxococcales bacterium]